MGGRLGVDPVDHGWVIVEGLTDSTAMRLVLAGMEMGVPLFWMALFVWLTWRQYRAVLGPTKEGEPDVQVTFGLREVSFSGQPGLV